MEMGENAGLLRVCFHLLPKNCLPETKSFIYESFLLGDVDDQRQQRKVVNSKISPERFSNSVRFQILNLYFGFSSPEHRIRRLNEHNIK